MVDKITSIKKKNFNYHTAVSEQLQHWQINYIISAKLPF